MKLWFFLRKLVMLFLLFILCMALVILAYVAGGILAGSLSLAATRLLPWFPFGAPQALWEKVFDFAFNAVLVLIALAPPVAVFNRFNFDLFDE